MSVSDAGTAAQRAIAELARARDIRLTRPWAVVVGLAMGTLAVVAKTVIVDWFSDPGYILLLAAVVAAAWLGGILAGVVALATTAVLHTVVLMEPVGVLVLDRGELFKQVFYVLIALGTVLLIGSRRNAWDRLADALAEVSALAQEVQAQDERLEFVLAASGTGIWEWDVVGGELKWSDAIFRQHGLEPGGSAPDFDAYQAMIHPDDRDRFGEAIRQAIASTGRFELEFRVVWADGSVHWTHGAGRVFHDEAGRPTRMVGTGQDITTRRRLEEERDVLLDEERRAREFREAFVDVVSHELRTPITTILGLTQILARPGRKDEEETRAALLGDVRAEAERLHRLIEDLLVLSRVEHGRLEAGSEPIEPRRLIERIVATEAAEHPSISVSLEVEPNLPIIAGEATYVEQVIRNLLNNAAKYTPVGTEVVVSASSEEDGVAFRVSDSGPGIPESSIERAFELFYRDPTSARTVSGSGIGLFVCASLVQAMGGRMWARRRPEGGAEFGFLLRALEPDDDLPLAIESGVETVSIVDGGAR